MAAINSDLKIFREISGLFLKIECSDSLDKHPSFLY
jgi:ribosomal protein S27E